MREERTEVLVVGAGPVGLLTAILLAEAGIEVRIIDREERTTSRSYACALHPRILQLLAGMGLAAPVVEAGRRLETIAFYDGASRQAEVKLSQLGGAFPFMVILPQNAFESLLEQRLRKLGVAVNNPTGPAPTTRTSVRSSRIPCLLLYVPFCDVAGTIPSTGRKVISNYCQSHSRPL